MAFAFPIRVYWEDTDAGGAVFHGNYLKFMERARTEWLRSLGMGQRLMREQTGGMFIVSQAQLEYLLPAHLDDQLLVTAERQSKGGASLTIRQQVLRTSPQGDGTAPTLLCEGKIRIGWVDGQTMRPARIPNRILEQFS